MKANQAFRNADEAVSPVIGVILMVAITVVLAAVVFVLVSNLSKTSGKAPDLSMSTDETRDRISLTTSASGLDWNDFQIKGTFPSGSTISIDLNEDAGGSDSGSSFTQMTLTNSYQTMPASGAGATSDLNAFTGGDFLDFCGAATVTGVTSLQILHRESNTIVYETSFNGIVAC